MKTLRLFCLALALVLPCSFAQTVTNGSRIFTGGMDGALSSGFRTVTGNGAPNASVAPTLCNNAQPITSSTNATPIVVTKASHGRSNGDVITVYGHGTNTAANSTWMVGSVTTNTFALCGYWDGTTCQNPSVGNGVGGATGFFSLHVGRLYFRNDATAGRNLYMCTDSTGSPAWVQQPANFGPDLTPNVYIAGGGTAQAQTATFSPAVTSLVAGLNLCWLPAAANTAAAPTFAPNGLTAKSVTKFGTVALAANDLTTTAVACALYDGTQWQLQNPQTAPAYAVNAQTATYQVLAADFALIKTIPVASGTFTVTLVASGSQPASGQSIDIINYGSGVVTVARSGQNINGGIASITVPAGSASAPTGLHVVSDGTNYIAQTWGGSGGGNTALTALAWMIWGNSYSSGSMTVNATGNRGHSQAFLVEYPITSTSVRFTIGTAAGLTKGAQVAIYADQTLTSPVCLSVVGTSGAATLLDINATGVKSFTWLSGSAVSGGLCTLQPNAYVLVISSDSTALAIANYGSIVGFQQISESGGASTLFYRFGDATSAVSTGTNSSVAINADISAVTWGQAAGAAAFSLGR